MTKRQRRRSSWMLLPPLLLLSALISAACGGAQPEPAPTPTLAESAARLTELERLGKGQLKDVAYAPDGEHLAVGTTTAVHLYDTHSFGVRWSVDTPEEIAVMAFSPKGRHLALGLEDGTLRVLRAADGAQRWLVESQTLADLSLAEGELTGHADAVRGLAYSPDGQTLASSSLDRTVQLWRAADGAHLRILQKEIDEFLSPAMALAFAPDGSTLASGSAEGIRVWRLPDGMLLQDLRGEKAYVDAVAYSPNGRVLAAGLSDGSIWLLRAQDGNLTRTILGHSGYVGRLAFSPDGAMLASAGSDGIVHLWRAGDGALRHTLAASPRSSPDLDGAGSVWVQDIAFSPDGERLATASNDGFLRIWRVADGALLETMEGFLSSLGDLDSSADGGRLASASMDGTVRLWGIRQK